MLDHLCLDLIVYMLKAANVSAEDIIALTSTCTHLYNCRQTLMKTCRLHCRIMFERNAEAGDVDACRYIGHLGRLQVKDISSDVLITACDHCDIAMLRFLRCEVGFTSKDVRDASKYAFWQACTKGLIKVVKFLIGYGLAVEDVMESRGLSACCRRGHLEVLRFIVHEKRLTGEAMEDAADGSLGPLSEACCWRKYRIVLYLVEHVGMTSENIRNTDALRHTAINGRIDIMRILLSKMYVQDVMRNNNLALRIAYRQRNRGMVRLLLNTIGCALSDDCNAMPKLARRTMPLWVCALRLCFFLSSSTVWPAYRSWYRYAYPDD